MCINNIFFRNDNFNFNNTKINFVERIENAKDFISTTFHNAELK